MSGPPTDTPLAPTPTPTTIYGLEHRIAMIGRSLAERLGTVVQEVHGDLHRPQELARTLGIDKVLSSRILKAIRNHDPIAVAHEIPGPESLRRLLRAAENHDADPKLIDQAEEAIADFECLIKKDVGDRGTLDAILSGLLPEARAKLELGSRQAMFRGASQIRGVSADLDLFALLIHPGADGEHHDLACLHGQLGLRRLRPGLKVKYGTWRFPSLKEVSEAPGSSPRTLDDETVEHLDGLILKQFCTPPLPDLEVQRVGEATQYLLGGNTVGSASGANVILGEVKRCGLQRYQDEDTTKKAFVWAGIGIPTKAILFDVLVHDDALPGCEPELAIYDSGFSGPANVNDSMRDVDRLDMLASIQLLGHGVSRFHAREIPRYSEMIRFACSKLGWNEQEFRGYRCRLQFPFYGSQITMAFDPPPAPATA